MTLSTTTGRIQVEGALEPGFETILTPAALEFVAELAARFTPRVAQCLADRRARQARWDASEQPGFLRETAEIRRADWTVAPLPPDLQDRRVEITGPVDRKMVINGLNAGARVYMADFEDSSAPTWRNMIGGQVNLRDAVAGTISHEDPRTGKQYRLGEQVSVLMVRPRGWHLEEAHLTLDGQPIPAALVDFGLYFFHNARRLVTRGSGPYLYLPKLESHLEARLWNDVFVQAQRALGLPEGTIKATVLIETLPAAFEMDEILYELRAHSAGLNCGRWDYIFSYIKSFRTRPEMVLPDRAQVGMTQPCMRAYSRLAIRTCHRRGVHAMGGMAAQIPIKDDPEANRTALEKVRADKLREATDGHDGTWVAHPGLVPLAYEVFDAQMPTPNQLHVVPDLRVRAEDLLRLPEGTRTEAGLRINVNVGILYLERWLAGTGCVPLYHLMEDAATAEISRTQLWQWLRHGARLEDGRLVDEALFETVLTEEIQQIRQQVGEERYESGCFDQAAALFRSLVTAPDCPDFLTVPAYRLLIERTES